eukprot:SAG22_NODE_302_length_12743_cov_12.397738_21_plen_86_part_00
MLVNEQDGKEAKYAKIFENEAARAKAKWKQSTKKLLGASKLKVGVVCGGAARQLQTRSGFVLAVRPSYKPLGGTGTSSMAPVPAL